jgi:hypothetical protein
MTQKNTFCTKFVLRASKRTKLAGIYCRITIKGSRGEFYTQKRISKNLWKNGQVIGATEEAKSIRSYLSQIDSNLFHHYRELLAQHKPINAEVLRNAYLGIEEEKLKKQTLSSYSEFNP